MKVYYAENISAIQELKLYCVEKSSKTHFERALPNARRVTRKLFEQLAIKKRNK